MADGRILSESDYEKLQQLFERERRRQGNPRSRSPHSDEIDFLPPEVYVARVPTGGIAPTSAGTGTGTGDDIEGVDCDIYRMVFTGDHTGRLVSANFQRTVYNPFIARVPAGWALVARDKYGIWYCSASNAGDDDEPPVDLTGPGGGSCSLARIKTTDCILATGPLNAVTMTGGGPWTSTGFKYLDVTDGTIVATWNTTTGFLDVTVDGMILMNCGNGCYTGGPLTGHVRSGTDTTDVCEGEVFTVCLTCTCCPTGIWDGPGWYCVNVLTDGTGTGTTAGYCEALELNDSHKCDPDIIICSGRYNTQAEAEAACGLGPCALPPGIDAATKLYAVVNAVPMELFYNVLSPAGQREYVGASGDYSLTVTVDTDSCTATFYLIDIVCGDVNTDLILDNVTTSFHGTYSATGLTCGLGTVDYDIEVSAAPI